MKIFKQITVLLLIMGLAVGACTNKKLENNIKSLEKRVAALEGKSGPASTAVSTPAVATSSEDAPVMSFVETEYDFGSVNEGEIVDYTFKFTNTGKQPLIISKATATCGCTVPEWPKQPIAVGGKGEIKVKFNSKNRKNLQTKYVNINANTVPPVTRLKITGNVIAADSNG
jgi:hypothetical protein